MEQPMHRYSHNNVAGPSNRSSPSYSSGPSSSYQRPHMMPQPRAVPDLHGRARKKAELNRLNQEIRLLEEELQRLDTLPPASEVCRLMVHSIEGQSDPFLANAGIQQQWDPRWDRWFNGPPIPRFYDDTSPTLLIQRGSFCPRVGTYGTVGFSVDTQHYFKLRDGRVKGYVKILSGVHASQLVSVNSIPFQDEASCQAVNPFHPRSLLQTKIAEMDKQGGKD